MNLHPFPVPGQPPLPHNHARYDPFGNINKNGTATFTPFYSATTNRMTSFPGGFTPTYDANGNVLNDGTHTYTWDAEGRPVTVDGVGLTFDALLRMVEQNRSGAHTEIVCAPTGEKLALMNGQSLVKAFVPLPGSSTAVYTATGLTYYRHPDWLGSSRLTSSPSRTVLSTIAYGPFGETYVPFGTSDPSFTGQNQDTSTGVYDFLFREYGTQGRWPSPDPAGLAAGDLSDPRSLNRYAYVLNDPLDFTDPLGLFVPFCYEQLGGNYQCMVDNGAGFFQWPCGGFVGWGCAPPPPPPPPPPPQGCIQSVFNPSCKPPSKPSCPAVFVNSAVKALDLPAIFQPIFPPGQGLEDVPKAFAAQQASKHIIERGLAVPLRSSIVRGILGGGAAASTVIVAAPILYAEVIGLKDEIKAWRSRECTTIWTDLGLE